jgi:hypothetical protein
MKGVVDFTNVGFWPLADMPTALLNVRYSSVSDQKTDDCDNRSGWLVMANLWSVLGAKRT